MLFVPQQLSQCAAGGETLSFPLPEVFSSCMHVWEHRSLKYSAWSVISEQRKTRRYTASPLGGRVCRSRDAVTLDRNVWFSRLLVSFLSSWQNVVAAQYFESLLRSVRDSRRFQRVSCMVSRRHAVMTSCYGVVKRQSVTASCWYMTVH